MNTPGLFSAALAGLLSFLSPCVLPLIPAYLSFISGSSVAALSKGEDRARLFGRSLAFSAGFTLAFTILGVIFSGSAMFVGGNTASQYVGILGGIVIIVLGINMLFDFLKFLSTDSRLIAKFTGTKTKGLAGSFVLGLAFAAGWSPCIGPILASILLMASREGNIGKAVSLLLAYSLGFALPFLASGLFFEKLKPLLSFLTKKGKTVRTTSGIVLIILGLAMALGSLGSFNALAAQLGYGIEDFILSSPLAASLIGAGLWLLIAALILWPIFRKAPPTTSSKNTASSKSQVSSRKNLGRIITSTAALALAGAELAGLFSVLNLIARWLSFSGI
ncbi:MAG: cytochrome c biogenesis protein CcdA [Spirochaetia bacterium]|jgi:cytochrome c-type biogenesis protein|nr:cytochrome c biogenesis protein CcdA [Spirochaetia bacterium]